VSIFRAIGGAFVAWAVSCSLAGAGQERQQPAPSSPLPLELIGILFDSGVPSRSVCLIRCTSPSRRERVYRTGETACESAEILEIRRDGAVVQNLTARRSEWVGFTTATSVPSTGSAPVVTASKDGVTVDLPKGSVDRYLNNLPDLLDSALATPRYSDAANGGTLDGFELSRIKESSIVEQVGLRNGDVILELNGEPLDSVAAALRLLAQAQTLTQARLTVLRNGRKMDLVLNRK
jgi:type II secretion system protein C